MSNPSDDRARVFHWFGRTARILGLILILASASAAQSTEPKKVLILSEEDISWPAFRLLDDNLRNVLRAESPQGISIFSEHLDRAHFDDEAVQAEQLVWIKKKYADSKLDLIIAVGDVPPGLFPDVPLLYLSADPRRQLPESAPSPANTTSVWVSLEAQKTVELALQLQPRARRIIVIGDDAPADDTTLGRLRNLYPTAAGNLPITYVTNPSLADLCHRLSEMGLDTIVIFTVLTRDDQGRPVISGHVVPQIAAASGAPVYVLADHFVGSGAVGGYVTSFAEIGQVGGSLGIRMLAGEHPQDVTVPNVYLFDWRQLQRWNISESALPVGSVISHREPTPWETYKDYIWAGVLLCAAELFLIVGLLWQRSKRKKAQQSVVKLMAFEKMLSQLSAIFINLPEAQVEATIENSLRQIAGFLGLNRITLFDYSPRDRELRMTMSWRGAGIQAPPSTLSSDKIPLRRDALLRGEAVLLSGLDSMPEEAHAEREYLKQLGTVSVATLPLMSGGEVFGGISFVSTTRRVEWTAELVDELKLLAEIFSNALMRRRAQDAQVRYTAIVESSNDAIIAKNLDGDIISWNAAAERLFGYSESEAVGQSIVMLIPPELRYEEDLLLRRLRTGERIEHHETVGVAKDGKKVAVSLTISSVADSSGATIGFSVIARDITDRKRAIQVLRESEERFRLVANTAPVLIWMSDTNKLCSFFNQGWLDFTGRSMEAEIGEGWVAGVHPEDVERCLDVYSASFDARLDFEMEYRLKRFDGEYRWVVDYGVPRFESSGTFCGYIGSCVDITERKASTESLKALTGRMIHAQEEERARIARDLHDDFSQRLALQCIELEQLRKNLPESEFEGRTRLQNLIKGTKSMAGDIRSLSHELHSSRLEFIGLLPAVSGLCSEITEKYKIDVQFTGDAVPFNIPKDIALCFFRVTQEALANVVKHGRTDRANVELNLKASGLVLRITDNGAGFDPTSVKSSAGIGLIGMTERLRLVGGKLSVRSEPRGGTEILAMVPMAAVSFDEQPKTMAAGGQQS